MPSPNRDEGWRSSIIIDGWQTFAESWTLDDYNECVNFYFWVTRPSVLCAACDGTGYNTETKYLADTFYDFDKKGKRWHHQITQDEVDALIAKHRLPEGSTCQEVNERERKSMVGHDGVNRSILIETRATRLGVYGLCSVCDGHGDTFTGQVSLSLVLWMLHPRKGAARGVEVKNIQEKDLPNIYAWLTEADNRNQKRFSKLKDVIVNQRFDEYQK